MSALSPTSRLALGAALAVAGGVACFVAARAAWASGPPQVIVIPTLTGFQSANLRVGGSTAPGTDLGAFPAAACAIGVIVLAVVGMLGRGRSRPIVLGGAVALAALGIAGAARAAAGARLHAEMLGFRHPSVQTGAVAATIAGAAVALVGATLAMLSAGRAATARLPEAAPGVATASSREPEGFDD